MSLFPHFTASCRGSVACLTWQVLPVLQPRPDDGLIELGDLPLQHGPKALSEAAVVLLQFLLVLLLVRCDQVLVLLHCLSTPTAHRVENYLVGMGHSMKRKDRNRVCYLTLFMYNNLKLKSSFNNNSMQADSALIPFISSSLQRAQRCMMLTAPCNYLTYFEHLCNVYS